MQADGSHAEQILFFATHELTETDTRLFRHYSRQLRAAETPAVLSVALFEAGRDAVTADGAASTAVEASVWRWGDTALRNALPNLATAMDRHPGLAATPDANHRRYYWFTASLLLWNMSFGAAYPRARFWWRIEPDVAFSGYWADFLRVVRRGDGRRPADVCVCLPLEFRLLPRVIPYDVDPGFPHYLSNQEVLQPLPQSQWCRSLVSLGRYSLRFMTHMAEVWRRGVMGYEEVFLPTQCLLLGEGCLLKSMHNVTKHDSLRLATSTPLVSRDEFRYRPEVACADVARAAVANSQLLFHPLKSRECWLHYLDTGGLVEGQRRTS